MPGTVLRSRTFGPLGWVALALFLLHPVSASAQDDTESRAYILSVKRLYEDLEYESALTQISRARAITHTPANLTSMSWQPVRSPRSFPNAYLPWRPSSCQSPSRSPLLLLLRRPADP
jgi:hypothetical protein